jgi:hypothetical protein
LAGLAMKKQQLTYLVKNRTKYCRITQKIGYEAPDWAGRSRARRGFWIQPPSKTYFWTSVTTLADFGAALPRERNLFFIRYLVFSN